MTLYSYKKAPAKKINFLEPKEKKRESATLGEFSTRVFNKLSSIKPISLLIPVFFIVSGLGILYGQLKPYATHYIKSKFSNRLNQEIVPLVPKRYERIRAAYISDPGAAYFSKLLAQKKVDKIDTRYSGTFYLTIKSIEINHVPVTANVNSFDQNIYKEALGNGLAHFRGTQLPGKAGNVFVYGHSAAGDYADRNPSDVVTAFTRLFDLNIGDTIEVEFEGKSLKYMVRKIKEVRPEDIDILDQRGEHSLTLMTCSPPGLNSGRLIVVASEI